MKNKNIIGQAISCLILIIYIPLANAQDKSFPIPDRHPVKDLPMQSILYELDQAITEKGASAAVKIAEMGMTSRADGSVNVEIINQKGVTHIDTTIVGQYGGEVDAVWQRRASVWINPEQLINLAGALPPGYFMKRASIPELDDEGPGRIGSDDYRDNGANGTGINIAIIDAGFTSLAASQTAGAAPATFTGVDYTGGGLTSGSIHGTGCVETVFDHAPGATYFLYRIGNLTHMGNAVNHAISNNVDIISHSMSRYNTGWDDNTGDACAAVINATDNDILFFTSAGNRAQQHWKGNFNTGSNSNNWHDWVEGDESIDISMPPQGSGNFYMCWDTDGGTYDYDLYLYNLSGTTILESSVNGGNNFEEFTWTNTSTTNFQTVRLYVLRYSGGTTEFEIFLHGSGTWTEYSMAASSTTSPSNSTAANVISVGAVDELDYDSASGVSGIIMGYSSQGPTNSGAVCPRITSPTNTTTIVYGGDFGGTSCATPNAAGATAALWSSVPNMNADGIRHLILEQAEIFKDWGVNGFDNVYGRGGILLHPWHAGTVWVDRRLANIYGSSTLPYYFISHAQSAAPSGGRIVLLGQSYPETITLNKQLLYESIGWPAVLGQ